MEINKDNIKKYADRYDKDYVGKDGEIIEKEIKEWFKVHRYLDMEKFKKIGLWKSKRPKKHYENNDDLTVREITQFSLATKSEKARIETLRVLNGVSYPVASVILHFAFPDKYPIMDVRAISSLGLEQKSYDFDFWENYCEKIRNISRETGENLRTIDKALWKYNKENAGIKPLPYTE